MKKTMIHTPHDKLFKSSLQYPEVAKEFLDLFWVLPQSGTARKILFSDELLKISKISNQYLANY